MVEFTQFWLWRNPDEPPGYIGSFMGREPVWTYSGVNTAEGLYARIATLRARGAQWTRVGEYIPASATGPALLMIDFTTRRTSREQGLFISEDYPMSPWVKAQLPLAEPRLGDVPEPVALDCPSRWTDGAREMELRALEHDGALAVVHDGKKARRMLTHKFISLYRRV